jgi:pimeloyl-ACP methyl ester carboxylesterase
MHYRSVLLVILLPALLFLQACGALPRPVKQPMDVVEQALACPTRPATLVVFLPGAYDKPQDFIDQGFVEALRKRAIQADVQLVDAHVAYYIAKQIVERLDRDVVAPALEKGYQQIWLVGISIGGYGSLLYSGQFPDKIDGFFVMAPYMGPRHVASAIKRQGGLINWSPGDPTDADAAFWTGLRRYGNQSPGISKQPTAYIGYGTSDRFEEPNRLFADILPADRRFAIAGGHDWRTWLQLWNQFLDVVPWPRATTTSVCFKN